MNCSERAGDTFQVYIICQAILIFYIYFKGEIVIKIYT